MTFYLERPLWRNKHHEVTRENLSEKDYRARLNKQRDIISVSETNEYVVYFCRNSYQVFESYRYSGFIFDQMKQIIGYRVSEHLTT